MIILFYAELLGVLLLLALSAFFSSAETALFSLDRLGINFLKRKNQKIGDIVEGILQNPKRILAVILIGNTTVNILISAAGYTLISTFLSRASELITVPLVFTFIIFFGELIPKQLAVNYPLHINVMYAVPLKIVYQLLSPLAGMLDKLSQFFLREHINLDSMLTQEELIAAFELAADAGIMDVEEKQMVMGILRLGKMEVRDVMTPRVDIIGIDLDEDFEKQKAVIEKVYFRHLPVFKDTLDNAVGFLDVLKFLLDGGKDIKPYIIPALFIPENVTLDVALKEFEQKGRRIAFVVDEFGGTAGVITRGDILEQITGEVEDSGELSNQKIQHIADGRWLVDGMISLEEFNYKFDSNIYIERADRLSGWIVSQLKSIPKVNSVVEIPMYRFIVKKVRKNRVELVEVERKES